MSKKLLFSVTAKDCRWDYYRGSGKGGQKKNKTSNCARCTHLASSAVGKAEEGRSQRQNRERAFRRMVETIEFKNWLKLETCRKVGDLAEIEKRVNKEIEDAIVEIRKNGKWTKEEPSGND